MEKQVFFDLFYDFHVIFSGAIGYYVQIYSLLATLTVGSFSPLVSLAILASLVPRVISRYFQEYSYRILYASLFMIFTQLVLLFCCSKIYKKTKEPVRFWTYQSGLQYLFITVFFFVLLAIVSLIIDRFVSKDLAPLFLSTLSALIESNMCLPQFLNNYQKASTEGLSKFLVMTWTIGDIFKIIIYKSENLSLVYQYGACYQQLMDVFIWTQIFYYRSIKHKP